jgi:hypothetical protein
MSGSRAALAILLCAVASGVSGQKKSEPYAIVAGTVFRDPGLALPEAKVVLSLSDSGKMKKAQETISNYRGEFSFRVPAREAKYVVKAAMKGYRPEEKEAAIHGEERVDVNLVLMPESK